MLARRVWPDGRTRAYVCGRSATVADLRELGGRLLAFYGQHEHRKLMLGRRPARHARRPLRRRAAGAARPGVRRAYERVRAARARGSPSCASWPARASASSTCSRSSSTRSRRSTPSEEEEAELIAERDRLRHLETLRRGGGRRRGGDRARRRAAAPPSCSPAAAPSSSPRPTIDPRWRALSERLQALRYEAEDLGGELRRYALERIDGGAAGGQRLEQVEERLALFARLQRKHGGSIAEVLAHAERCRARRERARARRRRARAGRGRARRGARRARRARGASCASAAREAAPELARPCARGWRSWRCPTPSFEVELRHRAGRLRSARGRHGRADDRRQPGRARRAAARDRLRRRALAGDARAAERRPRRVGRRARTEPAARVRRDRRRHRRPHRARRRRAPARARRGPPGALHHPPAAGRGARRPPLHDRQGHRRRCPATTTVTELGGDASSASSCGCSAPARATAPPSSTPAQLLQGRGLARPEHARPRGIQALRAQCGDSARAARTVRAGRYLQIRLRGTRLGSQYRWPQARRASSS